MGTIDPLGGINSLWPLFGIANQMLAAIALCVATTIIIKSGQVRHAWVTALPLAWLVTITTTAAWQKLFSPELRIGFLAHARDLGEKLAEVALPEPLATQAPQLIFNDRLDAVLTAFFLITTWVLVFETARVGYRILTGRDHPPFSESVYVPSRLGENET
jgi:carbon starvation protein